MTFLSMMENVSDELGLPRITAVIGSTRTDVRQLVALANREGKELARRFDWQKLHKEFTHTTLAQEDQGAVSTIMAGVNWPMTQTLWNRTQQDFTPGSLSPQSWQLLKAAMVTGPYSSFRIRGGKLLMIPAPTAGQTLAGEYVSKYWCESSGGTDQDEWLADTDVGILDEDLMEQGIIWRWLRKEGLEWLSLRDDYEMSVKERAAHDVPGETKYLDGEGCDDPVYSIRAPDGSWSL